MVDPGTVLLAVERVQGEVAALSRAVAATPEEVAARLDVDAAAAAIGVRVSALGSALDQLRLSLLAALDRTGDRLESPPWLADLQSVLVGLGRRFDAPVWMPELQGALAGLGSPGAGEAQGRQAAAEISLALERSPRLEELAATVASLRNDSRLDDVVRAVTQLAEGIRTGNEVAEALDHLGERLGAIEAAAAGAAREANALATRVGSVPERLSAIASQVDRITPLARVGDRAGTLFDRLDRVTSGVEEVVGLLQAGGAGGRDDEEHDDARFEAVVDVLSGVTRRQDEVTAAVGSMLDQIRSPKGLESVLERGEQRERSLAARLDRIDDELRRLIERGSLDIAPQASVLEAVRSTVERQEQELAARLERIDLELRRVGEAAEESTGGRLEELSAAVANLGSDSRIDDVAAAVAELADGVRAGAAVADALDGLGERLSAIEAAGDRAAQETRALAEQVASVPERLGVIAVQVERMIPAGRSGDEAETLFGQLDRVAAGVDQAIRLLSAREALAIDDRLDQLSTTVTRLAGDPGDRLTRIDQRLDGLVEELREAGATGEEEEDDDRFEGLVDVLSGVTRRQDDVAAAVAEMLDQVRSPTGEATAFGGAGRATEETARMLDTVLDRVQQQEQTIAEHLDWVGDRLAAFAAQLAPGLAGDGWPEDEGVGMAAVLDRMSRRQDELAAAISELVDQGRDPTATNAVFDRMEQRERSLAARLDRIDLELRRRAAAGGGDSPEAADESVVASLPESVDEVATVTSNLVGLVEDLAARLDHRLSNVEASLSGGRRSPSAAARPSPSSEVAALRLAEIRAERAQVQARLQEERLLAAEAEDES